MGILAELLSSKIRAEIFRNLFGIGYDTSLHMREIERRTGFAIGTVQTELKKLQRLDIVTRLKDGNRVYYRANTAHPLSPDIRAIVLKTNGLADVIKNALDNEKDIRVAFVFGSLACQQEKADSERCRSHGHWRYRFEKANGAPYGCLWKDRPGHQPTSFF